MRHFPAMDTDVLDLTRELIARSSVTPDDAGCQPLLASRLAQALGGRFRFRAQVVAIEQVGGRVQGVTLADGSRIAAPVVVNAAGPPGLRV